MVPASLHVEGAQIQRQIHGEFEQLFPQLIRHHVILRVQLGRFANEPPHDWVQTT